MDAVWKKTNLHAGSVLMQCQIVEGQFLLCPLVGGCLCVLAAETEFACQLSLWESNGNNGKWSNSCLMLGDWLRVGWSVKGEDKWKAFKADVMKRQLFRVAVAISLSLFDAGVDLTMQMKWSASGNEKPPSPAKWALQATVCCGH